MPHATLHRWYVVCALPPPIPRPETGIEVACIAHGELYEHCQRLSGLPSIDSIIALAARQKDDETDDALRVYAQALAIATDGVLLAEGPRLAPIFLTGKTQPSLEQAWLTLCRIAREGEETLEKEKASWRPDAADDWSNVLS